MEDTVLSWPHVSQYKESSCADDHESGDSPIPITSVSSNGNVGGCTVDSVACETACQQGYVVEGIFNIPLTLRASFTRFSSILADELVL